MHMKICTSFTSLHMLIKIFTSLFYRKCNNVTKFIPTTIKYIHIIFIVAVSFISEGIR